MNTAVHTRNARHGLRQLDGQRAVKRRCLLWGGGSTVERHCLTDRVVLVQDHDDIALVNRDLPASWDEIATRDQSAANSPLSIPIETPTKGRGGVSKIVISLLQTVAELEAEKEAGG